MSPVLEARLGDFASADKFVQLGGFVAQYSGDAALIRNLRGLGYRLEEAKSA